MFSFNIVSGVKQRPAVVARWSQGFKNAEWCKGKHMWGRFFRRVNR